MKPIYCPICNGPICSNINYKCDKCFYHGDPSHENCWTPCLQDTSENFCRCQIEDLMSFYYNKYPEFHSEFNQIPHMTDMENSYNTPEKIWLKRIIHFIDMVKDAENVILLEDDLFEM